MVSPDGVHGHTVSHGQCSKYVPSRRQAISVPPSIDGIESFHRLIHPANPLAPPRLTNIRTARGGSAQNGLVYGAIGCSTVQLLKPRGVFLCTDLAPRFQNPFLAIATRLLGGRRVRFPLPARRDRMAIEYFKELMESGRFRPVIDRRYHLDEIVEAYRYVETGQKIGNVVIVVEGQIGDP
jgi:Zinc-binding dehydrogenase